jgi:hypothetical protein
VVFGKRKVAVDTLTEAGSGWRETESPHDLTLGEDNRFGDAARPATVRPVHHSASDSNHHVSDCAAHGCRGRS